MNTETQRLIRQTLNAILYAVERGERAKIDGKAVLMIDAFYQTTIAAWIEEAKTALDADPAPF